ncbi:xanthine dehydrogenase accessory factor [Streptomyces sp. B3I7]|uniref:XdhC family protein n=1 Tax=Streptomyces sp. B3I7 TaxID=3042269 RepID=UPI002789835E|nr:XdhC/CoxI family protein [Streptomyces sp. B3I7]MDQ0810456.1 xanthine dehydrogenase accessory factor [Streptomyces sp. B3I7]
MLDIAEELHRWFTEGREMAVATVVTVHGSAPRPPGAALAVDRAGTVTGSVSGGCVEGAVYDLCRQALADGRPVRGRFGHGADGDGDGDDAFAIGLTCGGVLDVLVVPARIGDPAREVYAAAVALAAAGRPAALARVVTDTRTDMGTDASAGPDPYEGRALLVRPDGTHTGGLGKDPALDRAVAAEARAFLDAGRTGTAEVSRCGTPLTVLVEASAPPPRLIVFGAVDFTAALVRAGKLLGFHVTVCDARPVFATPARFPKADEVVVDWPHRYLDRTRVDARTALCVLTHEARFDVPLLRRALRLPLAYVGAMGSRRTHEDRLRRLREAGATETELSRLRSPIGLDLGARTPEETAVSIAAELVAVRRGGTGAPLTGADIPIHRGTALFAGRPAVGDRRGDGAGDGRALSSQRPSARSRNTE